MSWLLALTLGCSRPEHPNVLMIVLDTSRWDHFQTYGYERATSPNLQALGERGAVFDRAYTHTGWTGPSMASLMTSKVPRDHGLNDWNVPLAAEHTTLAEVLGGHGYQTMAVVSHFVFEPKLGFDQGFELYDRDVLDKGSPHRVHTSKEVTDRTLQHIQEADAGRPWFVWAHYFDPHYEYVHHEGHDFGRTRMDLYDSEIGWTDEQVGRLLDTLGERGELENTWIVFTADHGEEFKDHGGTQHPGNLYEELVHIPLVIVGPGVQPQRVPAVVRNSDLAPTLLGLLGLPAQDGFTGQPMPLDEGRFTPADRPVYMEVERHGNKRALLEGSTKLIRDLETDSLHLYDLSADPGEKTDLLAEGAPPPAEMLQRLDSWFATGTFEAPTQELSEADRKKLELLGYLEPSEEATAP